MPTSSPSFGIPSAWEMLKGGLSYFFPLMWFFIKLTWPVWIVIAIVLAVKWKRARGNRLPEAEQLEVLRKIEENTRQKAS